jgi:hypothetical protein
VSPWQEKFLVTRAGKNCLAVILTANKRTAAKIAALQLG